MEVCPKAQSQTRPPGQQPSGQIDGDALRPAHESHHPDIALGHEREWCEEVLAELPVRQPG